PRGAPRTRHDDRRDGPDVPRADAAGARGRHRRQGHCDHWRRRTAPRPRSPAAPGNEPPGDAGRRPAVVRRARHRESARRARSAGEGGDPRLGRVAAFGSRRAGVKIRKFALLVSVVGVCLLLLTLQARGYGTSARDLLALVTTPVQAGVARAHRVAFGIWDTYSAWKNVRAENRRLRDENQRPRAAVGQVLADPASTVGAHVVRTRASGIVEGDPRGTLRFKYMARGGIGIEVGDVLVTSGQGALFPRGIPIGRVRVIDDRG